MSRFRLGGELRRLRHSRSLRLEDVADRLGVVPSTVSRIETGKAPTRTSYLAVMLDLYGIDDAQQRNLLAELAREGRCRNWWESYEDLLPTGFGDYLDAESAASQVRSYSVLTVPDLLQTKDYAVAVYRTTRPELTSDQLHALITLQLRRQEVVLGDPNHRIEMIIDESAMLRSIGSQRVMANQRAHLFSLAAESWITVSVVGLNTRQPTLSQSFTLLSFGELAYPDLACHVDQSDQVAPVRNQTEVDTMRRAFAMLATSARLLHSSRSQQ